ncbi:hypothetical protein GGI17_005013 [Coemansia sp. S146]|nr:hypothetical protein GGI17_005013 [Coemansia sp. S146]
MADTNARLAALEQRCSTMEAQMRTQNAQVIDAFRKAISVLEASSTFGNAVDESGMLTAVDNSPSSELALKAVASNVADSATNLKCNTAPFMLDDSHPALKRRRTMADPRSMNRKRIDPALTDLANPRQRSLSVASNESGELGDEIHLFPDNERSQRMRHGDKVSGTSRRDQQQLESNNGARSAALNDCRRQDGASSRAGHRPREQERSPDSTFVDNLATPRDNNRGGRREQSDGHKDARNQSRHRSQERGVRHSYSRSPSRRHSSRRQSHGYNQGRSRSRSHSRSRNPTCSGSPYRNRHHDRRQYQERQNSPPPMEKPYLTGSNADPVPPGGPRRGRHNANRSPSPSTRPSPQKNAEGAKQKPKRGVVTWEFDSGSKHISSRVDKNADNNWGDLEPAEASDNRLTGWDIGSPELEAPKSGAKGWDVDSPEREAPNSGTKGWDVDSPVLDDTGPTMPRSINQLTSKVEPISSIEKVAAWKGADLTAVAARASPYGPEDAVKAALSDCGSNDLGDKARASSYAVSDRLYEDNIGSDDDDDDDDDPRMLLKSKKRRAEIIVSMLNDSGEHQLTSERLAPLWKIFAWIPLDTLPDIYWRVYGIDLWTLETKKQIRASIKYLPGLSERSSMDGLCRQALIFRDKCHLKQPRAYQRLFVMSPACEAVLFFFLVTTILQPLDELQAKTVANLWVDEFGKGPTHAVTTMQARGSATTKWESDEVVWKSAIQWLGQLAKITMQHGKDYLTGKTTNWDNTGLSSRKDSQAASHDPERELVAGLLKDELVELLKATPTLLSKILPEDKLRVLKSEVG